MFIYTYIRNFQLIHIYDYIITITSPYEYITASKVVITITPIPIIITISTCKFCKYHLAVLKGHFV